MDNSRILVISDLQAPYNHPDVIPFLKEVKKKYKPTRVINIGDLADFHGLNFHGVNPNLPSAADELILLRAFVKNLSQVFPVMEVVDSNHDALPIRKAHSVGLPSGMLKDIGSIMGAPDTWKYKPELFVKLPNGIYCMFKHNLSSKLLNDCYKRGHSFVCGHLHTKALVEWWWSEHLGFNFAMQVGCLIDDKSPAFGYNKLQALRPILMTGFLNQGVPFNIPFYTNKKNQWTGIV